jgi:hypothetical protein
MDTVGAIVNAWSPLKLKNLIWCHKDDWIVYDDMLSTASE